MSVVHGTAAPFPRAFSRRPCDRWGIPSSTRRTGLTGGLQPPSRARRHSAPRAPPCCGSPSPSASAGARRARAQIASAAPSLHVRPSHPCSIRSSMRSGWVATMNMRCRSCGPSRCTRPWALSGFSPTARHVHSASNPRSARPASTARNPRERSPSTFSTTTTRGEISEMIRRYSNHSPERAPSSPSPLPARDRSWQGNPPQSRSTCDTNPCRISRTSERCVAPGQCRAST